MASKNICTTCKELMENYTEFYENGVTDAVCDSLKRNKGLNGKSNNCKDLDLVNDCLNWGHLEKIPAYSECEWEEYTGIMLQNLATMNDALICAVCGLQDQINALALQNISVEARPQILQNMQGLSLTIDRQGNWEYNYVDWVVEGSQEYGRGKINGKVNFCMVPGDGKTASWRISSVYIDKHTYTFHSHDGAVSEPSVILRVPNSSGSIVYQKTNMHSSFTDTIDKTINFSQQGSLAPGQTTDWITFADFAGDWVVDTHCVLQVRFSNKNVSAIPTC